MITKKPLTFAHTHQALHSSWYVSDKSYEGESLQLRLSYREELIVAQNWFGLFDYEHLNRDGLPWDHYNVHVDLREEGVVYLGLCWRIVQEQHLECYAIPSYHRDEAALLLKKPFDFVSWEYRVKAEDPHQIEDQGFIPARSRVYVSTPPPHWQYHQQAGLFKIETFSDLVALQKATLSDATSEITLFCVPPDRKQALVAFLNTTSRPEVAQFLASGEVFIDLLIGIDMYYYDSLLLKTLADTSVYVDALAQEYNQAIAHFEACVDTIQDMETYLQVLSRLAQAKYP